MNGADLLQLSVSELSHDIRLTPFAARKVGAASDEFLGGLGFPQHVRSVGFVEEDANAGIDYC